MELSSKLVNAVFPEFHCVASHRLIILCTRQRFINQVYTSILCYLLSKLLDIGYLRLQMSLCIVFLFLLFRWSYWEAVTANRGCYSEQLVGNACGKIYPGTELLNFSRTIDWLLFWAHSVLVQTSMKVYP